MENLIVVINKIYSSVQKFQFNLLGLPNEIITRVFTFLPIADRMRARLNRRLNEIEAKNKYYLKSVLIAEVCALLRYFYKSADQD